MPEYRVVRSRRRTIGLEITPAGEVLVRAPTGTPDAYIREFVLSRQAWVETHLARVRERIAAAEPVQPFTKAELEALRKKARPVFEERVSRFAPMVGVGWGSVSIRFQHSRWGSCSARGNLNFNALLLLAPAEVLDYVVVHELCHRKELNHSPRFWAEVARIMPDWRKQRLWLKQNGAALMARLPRE